MLACWTPGGVAVGTMRRAWVIVVLVFFFMLINYADKAVFGLSSVAIIRDLGLTRSQFGLLGSAFFLLFSVSGVVVGFLTRRIATRAIMGSMAVLWAGAMVSVSLMPGVSMLLASRVVLGAAEGPAFPVAMHTVYQWFRDADRTMPSSVVAIGSAFGSGILAPLITWAIVGQGWRATFGGLGVVGLLWALLWMLIATQGPLDQGTVSTERHAVQSYRRLLLSPTAIGVYLAGFAAYTLITLGLVWLANYLIDVLHLSPQRAASWIVVPSAAQIVLAPLIAFGSRSLTRRGWSGRWSRGFPGALCVVTAGACVMLLPFAASDTLRIVLLGLGFSVGSVFFTLGSTLLGEIAPVRERGALLGVANSIHASAGLLVPYAMGRMIDLQQNPAAGFQAGFLVVGAFVVAMGVAAGVLINPGAEAARLPAHGVAA